jgi:cell division GTPase FtsZ
MSKFMFERESGNLARITVAGVGGAGGNAINCIRSPRLSGSSSWPSNALALQFSRRRIQQGALTKVWDRAAPEVGRRA